MRRPSVTVRVDVYAADVAVYTDRDELLALYRRSREEPGVLAEPDTHAFAGWLLVGPAGRRTRRFVVWLPEDAPPGQVAHEAVHVACEVLDSRGVLFGPDNQEPLAYLVQFLVDRFTAAIAR